MSYFREIASGTEELPANFHMPRHRHQHAYATGVLGGAFEEAGYAGRIKASAGDVLIHPVLDCHINRMISPGIRLLRLPWPDTDSTGGLYRIDDPDAIVKAAEKDAGEAQSLLTEILRDHAESRSRIEDWPDLLAEEIKAESKFAIGHWAERNGLARETVARGFSQVWGIPPSGFRAEWRARCACLELTHDAVALSAIAARTGFSDQAHMTRWVGRITGVPPSVWRSRTAESSQAHCGR